MFASMYQCRWCWTKIGDEGDGEPPMLTTCNECAFINDPLLRVAEPLAYSEPSDEPDPRDCNSR